MTDRINRGPRPPEPLKPWTEFTITRTELPFGWYVVGEINPRRLLLGVSWEAGGIDTTHFKHTWRTVWVHFLWLRLVFSWTAQEEHLKGLDA